MVNKADHTHAYTDYLLYTGIPYANRQITPLLMGPALAPQGILGYHPADIRAAYNIPANAGSGAIACVDAFDLSSALTDFNQFSRQFGLPVETSSKPLASTNKVFQVIYATTNGQAPQSAHPSGWDGEEVLDIEWAHAMAPNAKIYLVEAASDSGSDLFFAESRAAALSDVREVSNSWGSPEFSGEQQLDSTFVAPGKVFFASSGDLGGFQQYPSESPNVVGVGGTSLHVSTSGIVQSETAWDGSGGGPSSWEPIPPFQAIVAPIVGNVRGTPDCSAVADPATGVAIFSTTAFGGSTTTGTWVVIGGTSLACPVTAAITNDRDTVVNSFCNSSGRELERIYFNLGGAYYRDITSGTAGSFTSVPGWDFITGIGSAVGLFPNYIPAETRLAGTANRIEGARDNGGGVASIQYLDNVQFAIVSNLALPGQTGYGQGQQAALKTQLNMDHSLSSLSAATIQMVTTAPLATTMQVYLWNWNTNRYDYIMAKPATGQALTMSLNIPGSSYVGTFGNVEVLVRAIRPPRLQSGPFTFYTDLINLQEVTVPPWDPGGPL